MKKLFKILGVLVLLVVVVAAGFFTYVRTAYPKPGAMRHVNIPKDDAALVERGRYLANNVSNCIDCHTPRKLDEFGIPHIEGEEGKGGMLFSHDLGFPGEVYSKNITPAGIGGWTDDEVYHTITTGVNKNGVVLFPNMPYPHFRMADSNDIRAIVAYLRTLKPVDNSIPESSIDFPVSLFIRMVPQPANPQPRPAESDSVKYGAYVFNMAACTDCHTPQDKGKPIEALTMAGGFEFHLKGQGMIRSANVTPDNETGIGLWTEQMFVDRFKYYSKPEHQHKPWKEVGYQTVMPWYDYSGMKESDLRSLYKYLRTVKPVKHQVVRFTAEDQVAAK